MSYEQDCEDYARFGDPMRDHEDYEAAAIYDRFDGWGDPDYDDYHCDCDCNCGPVFVELSVPDDAPF
jgi:hypothetical protein